MAGLACDLCGGKLVMGSGGVATCETCGMEYSAERMREKVAELKGGAVPAAPAAPVAPAPVVDNSKLIENYLELAYGAYDADNSAEAESYCNKVIELDVTNYKAWFLKGKAAGWQSTLQNQRFPECISAFSKAVNNAPEEEKESIKEQCTEEVKNLARALIRLRGNRFEKWPDEDEANGFFSDITNIIKAMTQFITQAMVVIPMNEMMDPIATQINQSVVAAWKNKILPDYNGDDGRPNEREWKQFIARIGYCTRLVEQAIDLSDDDDQADIVRYENLIFFHEQAIDSCSWDYEFTSYGKSYHKDWSLTEDAKNIRRGLIKQYQAKIDQIKAEQKAKEEAEKKARIDAYWAEHAEEKAALESEKESLENQIAELKKEKDAFTCDTEVAEINKKIADLNAQKSSLGIFKGKEKKAIQDQIDVENGKIAALKKDVEAQRAEVQKKISPLQNRVNEINAEFTKER